MCHKRFVSMRVLLIYLTLMLLFGCGEENQIHIFKQWHLSPKDKTTDIQKSTQLKQFENQLDIYKSLASLIEKGEVKLILAEGCESKIKLSDSELFNGWSMKSLAKYKDSKDFDKIMAPIGMKLKVKYPNLKVLCGDNLELIKENQKAMSDLRGYSSFYFRLVEYQKSDAKKFDLYKKQLQSLFPKTTIEFPIKFALEKSIASLKMFERLIEERNLKFQRLARKHYQKNPAIIIGGLHTNDLRRRFDELKLNYKVYTPKGYENDELKLLDQLKENLNEKINDLTFFYQVPEKFNPQKFPLKNLFKYEDLLSERRWNYLKSLIKGKYPENILLSDYDQDGIRDFTLSTNGEMVIITAEDDDWDNDGIFNLHDKDIGPLQIAMPQKVKINNNYFSQSSISKIRESISSKVTLVSKESSHELLVIEVLDKILSKFKKPKFNLRYLNATTSSFSYGKKVFFSYVRSSQSLEYYPEKLNKYLNEQLQTRFKGAEISKFVNSFVVPLIVHSVTHELAHALEISKSNLYELSKSYGWSFDQKENKEKYLSSHRLERKKIKNLYLDQKFKAQKYKDWLQKINKDNVVKVLEKNKIPSLYALSSVEEWFAENFSMCLYQVIYPESKGIKRSKQIYQLLGILPHATQQSFCSQIGLSL